MVADVMAAVVARSILLLWTISRGSIMAAGQTFIQVAMVSRNVLSLGLVEV